MEETTDRRPNQEPTLLDQIEEQQPSTVQTEAEIHFDEGATHSDRLQVNVIQLEPRENPLEQPVDIPPGPSGIQHSPSQEIEVAAHSQPSTPTNEAPDVISQNLNIKQNLVYCFKQNWLLNMGLVMIIQPTMLAAYLVFFTSEHVIYLIKCYIFDPTFQFNPLEISASIIMLCLSVILLLPFIWLFGLIKGGHKTPFTQHFYMNIYLMLGKFSDYPEENTNNQTIRTNVTDSSV